MSEHGRGEVSPVVVQAQSPFILGRVKSTEDVTNLTGELFHFFEEREVNRSFATPISADDLAIFAKYYSTAWTYYPGFLANALFWSYVAGSYATLGNNDEYKHDKPARGLVWA